jgi:hypothetical protein
LNATRRIAGRAGALAAALALLGAPAVSDAQTRAKRSTAAPAATTPRPAAAPPKAFEVPLPPPPAAAPPARLAWMGVSAGPFVGLDRGSGFTVAIDYGRTATPSSWRRAELELHLPVTISRPTNEEDLTVSFTFLGETFTDTFGSLEETATLVEVVPTARLRVPIGPARKVALFADGGVGLAFGVLNEVDDQRFSGRTETTDAAMALALRLGAGLSYDATPRLRLLFQPVALTFHAGTDWSSYTALAGLSYRL